MMINFYNNISTDLTKKSAKLPITQKIDKRTYVINKKQIILMIASYNKQLGQLLFFHISRSSILYLCTYYNQM